MERINVIYLRKSREDLEAEQMGVGETLARHRSMLMETSKIYGLPVKDENILTEIVSGETIQDRPQMQKLLSMVESGIVANVLVVEVQRLARGNTSDQGRVSNAFTYSNTKIVTPSKVYDPNDPNDAEYFEFGLFMSRREFVTTNRRLKSGREASCREGKYVGSIAPYGYSREKVEKGKGYQLVENESESMYLKMMFDMYVNGSGAQHIATVLNEMHVPTRYSQKWTPATIRTILKNPVYTGSICYRKRKVYREMENGVIKKVRKPNHDGDEITASGLHKQLITQEIFDLAQTTRKSRDIPCTNNNKELKNELSGLLKCGGCGKNMTLKSPSQSSPRAYLKCRYACGNKPVAKDIVVARVLQCLQEWTEGYQIEDSEYVSVNSIPLLENSLKTLCSESERVQNQMNKACELLELGMYSNELFAERTEVLTERKKELKSEITRIQEKIDREKEMEKTKGEFIPKVQSLLDCYNSLSDATQKNLLLKEVIDHIDIWKTETGLDNFKIRIYPKIPKR